jgi:hypothetical protein
MNKLQCDMDSYPETCSMLLSNNICTLPELNAPGLSVWHTSTYYAPGPPATESVDIGGGNQHRVWFGHQYAQSQRRWHVTPASTESQHQHIFTSEEIVKYILHRNKNIKGVPFPSLKIYNCYLPHGYGTCNTEFKSQHGVKKKSQSMLQNIQQGARM